MVGSGGRFPAATGALGMQALRLAAKPFKRVADTVRRKTTIARCNSARGDGQQEHYVCVPPNAVPGEDFVAEISPDQCAVVTVPQGVGPGDLLQVRICYDDEDIHLEVLQHIQCPTINTHNHRKLRTLSSATGFAAMLVVTIAILLPSWVATTDAEREHIGLLSIYRDGFTQKWDYIDQQCSVEVLETLSQPQLDQVRQRCHRDFRLKYSAQPCLVGLVTSLLIQTWGVLSVTATRFRHAMSFTLLSMSLHGWAVVHFLLEVHEILGNFDVRWSAWFSLAGFCLQMVALLLVLVLHMRFQQSSRLLGLDLHFLEDVMLLREAQDDAYSWDETDPGAGCPILWRTYGFTPADLYESYKGRPFGWLRATLLYLASLPSHFLKTFDWNGIRRVWYGPASEENAVRNFGVSSTVVINYMMYRRSNIIMTVVFLGLFIVWSLVDFRYQHLDNLQQLERDVKLTSYQDYVRDQAVLGENATFFAYTEEVMGQAFSAISMQSRGLATWKAIIKMLFLLSSFAYSFFAMLRWNYFRTSQYNMNLAWVAIITFPFLITFVPTSALLDWTLSEKIFARHIEETRKFFHADAIVAACVLNDPYKTYEVAGPVIKAVCPILQQRVPFIMPGIVSVKVLGQVLPITIKSWLPWVENMVPEGTNLKPVHIFCEKALAVVDNNVTIDVAQAASSVCQSVASFLYKNVPEEATTALTQLKEALQRKPQESAESSAYKLHFGDEVAELEDVPLRLFRQSIDDTHLDAILVRPVGTSSLCTTPVLVPEAIKIQEALLLVGPLERGGKGWCSVKNMAFNAKKVGARGVLIYDPKRTVHKLPSIPPVMVGVIADDFDAQAIMHVIGDGPSQKGVRVDVQYSPVFGLQNTARTSAGCLCKGMGYDSDCRVRPAGFLSSSNEGKEPFPWCETAQFDYWGALCLKDFDVCVPPGLKEAYERPNAGCKSPCGREGMGLHDYCKMKGTWLTSVERPLETLDESFEAWEGMLNFDGPMARLKGSGRLLTLRPSFDCSFRVLVQWPSSSAPPKGVVRYISTNSADTEWSEVGLNTEFREGSVYTELHIEVEVQGRGSAFNAVRLEQQCTSDEGGLLGNWTLVPYRQLRIPTAAYTPDTATNRRLDNPDLGPPLDETEDSEDDCEDTGDYTTSKIWTCSEFVGVKCIDPAANMQTRCAANQVCDSNFTDGGGFCRCADGYCWSVEKLGCVDQSEHARELVSKLLDETMLERHSPKLWATAKEVATVSFCALQAAESLNNILRHLLAIGPGVLISAWTAKLIFVQSTIPGYFAYFFTLVYSPSAWVLNNIWHQTAGDWKLSMGLGAMAFWTIPVSVVGIKYGLHRPMTVARAMSLVNNLLLFYYFILGLAVVMIVLFIFTEEPPYDAYFSVRASFRHMLRPGKLSKAQLVYRLSGFLSESFAVFFITCVAACDAFITLIAKEHDAAWAMLTRGNQRQLQQGGWRAGGGSGAHRYGTHEGSKKLPAIPGNGLVQ